MQLTQKNSVTTLVYRGWSIHVICDGSYLIRPEALNQNVSGVNYFGRRSKVRITVNYILIVSPAGRVSVVDSGLGGYSSHFFNQQHVKNKFPLQQVLNEWGITAKEIDQIILTHFHEDHVGGLSDLDFVGAFKDKPIFIQKEEWSFRQQRYSAMNDEMQRLTDNLSSNINVVDRNFFVNDVIQLQFTGGHTPGHQMVLIKIADQVICYPADIIPSAKHAQRELFSYNYDENIFKASRSRILEDASTKKWILVFSHSPRNHFVILDKTKENSYITSHILMQRT